MFEVDYYEDSQGKKLIEEFIDKLDLKMKAKVFGRIELLEQHGSQLGMPFSKHLSEGIFELRIPLGATLLESYISLLLEKESF